MNAKHSAPVPRRLFWLGVTILSASTLLANAPSAALQASLIDDPTWGPWMRLLGRLHFALVHFPIGLLIGAGLIELLASGRQGAKPRDATLACLGLGWISAGLAAWSGWTYAAIEPHGHSADGLLFWHRWGGVAMASLAFVTWCCGYLGRSGKRGWARSSFTVGLFLTAIGTGVVGHVGGTLVNGEDYLTEVFDTPPPPRAKARSEKTQTENTQPEEPAPAGDPGQADDVPDPAEVGSAPVGSVPPALDLTGVAPSEGGPAGASGNEPGAAASQVSYAAVEPIFERSCFHCHGVKKAKGGLRLNSEEAIFSKSPEDWVAVPGHPKKSELLRRLRLPFEHEDMMPADDDALAAEEIALIEAWIVSLKPVDFGLPADGGTAGSAMLGDWAEAEPVPRTGPATDSGATPDASPTTEAQGAAQAQVETPTALTEPIAVADTPTTSGEADGAESTLDVAALDERSTAALARLSERGAVAGRVAADTRDVDVVFGLLRTDVGDLDLALLSGLEDVLVSLDLSRTAVTDDGLVALAGFPRLQRLRLDNTAVGDAGLAHLVGAKELRYLNLYGTQVTDEGLGNLAGLEHLKKLYLWQTPVTDAGVAALSEALPEIEIVRDVVLPEPPPPDVVVEGETTFAEHAGPIFTASCVQCHGAEKQSAGLRFDTFEALFEKTPAEWPMEPGKGEASRLIAAVRLAPGSEGAMPKEGDPLTEEQVATLVAWIDGLRLEAPAQSDSSGQ